MKPPEFRPVISASAAFVLFLMIFSASVFVPVNAEGSGNATAELPDLAVKGMSASPAIANLNDVVIYRVDVENVGNVSAEYTISVDILRRGSIETSTASNLMLLPGGMYSMDEDFVASEYGEYTITASVTVTDSDEANLMNNQNSLMITVNDPGIVDADNDGWEFKYTVSDPCPNDYYNVCENAEGLDLDGDGIPFYQDSCDDQDTCIRVFGQLIRSYSGEPFSTYVYWYAHKNYQEVKRGTINTLDGSFEVYVSEDFFRDGNLFEFSLSRLADTFALRNEGGIITLFIDDYTVRGDDGGHEHVYTSREVKIVENEMDLGTISLQGECHVDGVCTASEDEEICPEDCRVVVIKKCFDSDGGKVFSEKGTVSFSTETISGPGGGVGGSMATDYCRDEGSLVEFFCIENEVSSLIHECSYFCSDGACKEQTDVCGDGTCSGDERAITCKVCEVPDCLPGTDCAIPECEPKCHVQCRQDCLPDCGNGMCESSACVGMGCPIAENKELCPEDCLEKPTYMKLSTDKSTYELNAPVTITAYASGGNADGLEITFVVRNPMGVVGRIRGKGGACGAPSCPPCQPGALCEPCYLEPSCQYTVVYENTDVTGMYTVTVEGGPGVRTYGPVSFKVVDYSLLRKYLIMQDIEDFRFEEARTDVFNRDQTVYAAMYRQDGRQHVAGVVEFENREQVQDFIDNELKTVSGMTEIGETRIGGFFVYVLQSGYSSAVVWTHKNFMILVVSQAHAAPALVVKRPIIQPAEVVSDVAKKIKEGEAGGLTAVQSPITGGVVASPEITSAETMESTIPAPESGGTSSACESEVDRDGCRVTKCSDGSVSRLCPPTPTPPDIPMPLPVIKAYLEKYPSDVKAIGTDCASKGGYCTYSQCQTGYMKSDFSCGTPHTCCVKEVDSEDLLMIVLKLESMRVHMDKLEKVSLGLADYYFSIGDEERTQKFKEVADLFGLIKSEIDRIITKIRQNINNPDFIKSDLRGDVDGLKRFIRKILEALLG